MATTVRLQVLKLRQSFCILAMAAAVFGAKVATISAWNECFAAVSPLILVVWPHIAVFRLPATKRSIWLTPLFECTLKAVTIFLKELTELSGCQLKLVSAEEKEKMEKKKQVPEVTLNTTEDFFKLIRSIKQIERHRGIGFPNFSKATEKRKLIAAAANNQSKQKSPGFFTVPKRRRIA